MAWTSDTIEVRRGAASRTIAVPSQPSDATLAATFDEFTAALDERRAPETALADNMQTLAMVYAAIRSAEQGVPIALADMLGSAPR